jgi:hypothetical protein
VRSNPAKVNAGGIFSDKEHISRNIFVPFLKNPVRTRQKKSI